MEVPVISHRPPTLSNQALSRFSLGSNTPSMASTINHSNSTSIIISSNSTVAMLNMDSRTMGNTIKVTDSKTVMVRIMACSKATLSNGKATSNPPLKLHCPAELQ